MPRRNKYGARPRTVGGIRFASQAEAARYIELKRLEARGEIEQLELQPRYDLHALGGGKVARYTADFRYLVSGLIVVEDVKGVETREFRRNVRHMWAEYGIKVRIIKNGKIT